MSYYADDNGIKRFLSKFKTLIGNASLTTTAQTIIGAINELKTSLTNKADKTWKYAGWAYASSSVTIPENYTEAIVYLFGTNSARSRRISASITFFPALWGEQINNKIEFLVAGYHLTDSDHGYGCIAVTNNGKTFTAQSLNYGSGSVEGRYVMVYYR